MASASATIPSLPGAGGPPKTHEPLEDGLETMSMDTGPWSEYLKKTPTNAEKHVDGMVFFVPPACPEASLTAGELRQLDFRMVPRPARDGFDLTMHDICLRTGAFRPPEEILSKIRRFIPQYANRVRIGPVEKLSTRILRLKNNYWVDQVIIRTTIRSVYSLILGKASVEIPFHSREGDQFIYFLKLDCPIPVGALDYSPLEIVSIPTRNFEFKSTTTIELGSFWTPIIPTPDNIIGYKIYLAQPKIIQCGRGLVSTVYLEDDEPDRIF